MSTLDNETISVLLSELLIILVQRGAIEKEDIQLLHTRVKEQLGMKK